MTLLEWAPSRFRLAGFRLLAALRVALAGRATGRRPPMSLSFAPGQVQWELRFVSTGWFLTAVLISTAAIARTTGLPRVLLPAEFVVAVPITFLALTLALWIFGAITFAVKHLPLFRTLANDSVQSLLHNALLLAACAVSIRSGGWVRWVGVAWLSFVALDVICWIILLPLRGVVRAVDARLIERESVVLFK